MIRPLFFLGALVPVFASLGCSLVSTAQYQAMSAGAIGCPRDEVAVSDQTNMAFSTADMTWTAQCRGHRYICSYAGMAACKEELPRLAPAEAPVLAAAADGGGAVVAANEPPPAPAPEPIEPNACSAAEAYDRRVANAESPVKEQLQKLADRKHKECELLRAAPK